jgi:hypothetical protein
MNKFRVFVLLASISLLLVIVSGCGGPNPYPIRQFTVFPDTPTKEGTTMTVTMEISFPALGTPQRNVRMIGVFFKPKSFSVVGDAICVVDNLASPTQSIWLRHITSGPALDGLEIVMRKVYTHPVYGPMFAAATQEGHDFWVAASDVFPSPASPTPGYGIATVESGCVGTFKFIFLLGGMTSAIPPESFAGCGRAYVIDSTNNDSVKNSLVGLGDGGASRFGSLGVFGADVKISDVSGRSFVMSYPWNFNQNNTDGYEFGLLVATNTITILDSDDKYFKTIRLPENVSEPVDGDFAPSDKCMGSAIDVAGEKLYVNYTDGVANGGSPFRGVRVYDENGSYEGYLAAGSLGGKSISYRRFAIAATNEGNVNYVFSLGGAGGDFVNLHCYKHYLLTGTSEMADNFSVGFDTHSVFLLPGRRLAVTGGHTDLGGTRYGQIDILSYNADGTIVTSNVVTPEGFITSYDHSPAWAVVDPSRGRLYVAGEGPYYGRDRLASETRIWVVSFEGTNPTLEAEISLGINTVCDYFAIDTVNNRLYVPCPAAQVVKIYSTISNEFIEKFSGVTAPVAAVIEGLKLYIVDGGRLYDNLGDAVFAPPENFGNCVVNVYNLPSSGMPSLIRSIPVGYGPTFARSGNGKVAVLSTPIPSFYTDFDGLLDFMTFEAWVTPEVRNVMINGGRVADKDYVSNNAILTADLWDDSGIWSARLIVDGVEKAATYSPTLPGNTVRAPIRLTYNLGSLGTGEHAITIEADDHYYSTSWDVFGLTASPGGSVKMRGGYPSIYPGVFKPQSGKTPMDRTLRIAYELTVDAPIDIMIIDVSGKPVFTRKYASRTMGGRAGYNEVSWDGWMDTGGVVGNGIYPYKIISKGKVIASGKIVVYD